MIDKYEQIFQDYKNFIIENSKYSPRVVKYNTNTSSYFPIITFILMDNVDTNSCTICKREYYESHLFTIDIYTKDKKMTYQIQQENDETLEKTEVVASEIINNELVKLTTEFFGNLNMKKTFNSPTFNLDSSILRRTLRYQCYIGNVRGNIIRR